MGVILSCSHLLGGTGQGCLLSPLLCNWVVESLSILLRKDPTVIGFGARGDENKIILYAEDILMFISEADKILHYINF